MSGWIAATPSSTAVTYGDDLYISVDVASSDGYSPGGTDGTVTLFAMEAGSSAWVPVATAANTYSSFYDVKPKANTAYKVVYSGFTDPDQGTYGDNYTPSESAPFTIGVTRNVKIDNAKARMTIKGKIKPKYKKKKVKVQIKKGKRYVKFKTVKTTRRSTFQVRLPAPRRGNKLYFNGLSAAGVLHENPRARHPVNQRISGNAQAIVASDRELHVHARADA